MSKFQVWSICIEFISNSNDDNLQYIHLRFCTLWKLETFINQAMPILSIKHFSRYWRSRSRKQLHGLAAFDQIRRQSKAIDWFYKIHLLLTSMCIMKKQPVASLCRRFWLNAAKWGIIFVLTLHVAGRRSNTTRIFLSFCKCEHCLNLKGWAIFLALRKHLMAYREDEQHVNESRFQMKWL